MGSPNGFSLAQKRAKQKPRKKKITRQMKLF
jgi:hypothetical protein